jgi:hypothetical protein
VFPGTIQISVQRVNRIRTRRFWFNGQHSKAIYGCTAAESNPEYAEEDETAGLNHPTGWMTVAVAKITLGLYIEREGFSRRESKNREAD